MEEEEQNLPTEVQDSEITSDDLQQVVAKIAAEKAELEDRYLRKHADFENYRKRMTKEKSEATQYANAELMRELLDVLDNLQRAQEASHSEKADMQSVRNGVTLIAQTLFATLTGRGLHRMETMGKEFDPQLHQAIANTVDDTVKVPTVVEEYQAGYTLFDRVLRPAMVRVAMPAAQPSDALQKEEAPLQDSKEENLEQSN